MEGSAKQERPEAEARHATILICDIVSSTQAKKLLDLDGQLEFQRRSPAYPVPPPRH
jgi:hypothetical protein